VARERVVLRLACGFWPAKWMRAVRVLVRRNISVLLKSVLGRLLSKE
jgi:hypothetical protein